MSTEPKSYNISDPESGPPAYPEPAKLGGHVTGDDVAIVDGDQGQLHRRLKGRHMQMIAM
jgi:amino acid permease